MAPDILLDVADKIATITLNRPERRNAFTLAMIDAWADALEDCRARSDVHAVVVTGAGKAFCSGGDISELMQARQDLGPVDRKAEIAEHVHRIPRVLDQMDKPLIAAVNGAAIGAGLDLALMADIRFAATSARFGETYVKVGLAPGACGAHFLPRIVGTARALELLWTGDLIEAAEAAQIGLVNRVWPDDELIPQTMDFAGRLATGPSQAIRGIKRLVREGLRADMPTSLELASSLYGVLSATDDHREAVDAFLEKRAPRFAGT